MPIHISEALLMGVAGADVPTLEQQLWIGAGGTCALCSEAIDREDDELEAGRDGAGGLHLSHARCHHDVVGDGDRVRLESELADNPAGYLKRRGWRKSRAKRVDPRVPLLRAGSERRWTWLVEGALADGSGVQLGCLAISFGGEGGEDHEGVFIEGDGEDLWTVVVLDANYPDIGFVTLTEHARELAFDEEMEAKVLRQCHQGLLAEPSNLSAQESVWVMHRLAELLDWVPLVFDEAA